MGAQQVQAARPGDETVLDQGRQDAEGGGGMQPGFRRQDFREVPSPSLARASSSADHAVDDLDGGVSWFVHVSHYET
jgi:hypothetical protein